jgi:hypothetical protein
MGRSPKFLEVGERFGRLVVVATAGQEEDTGKTLAHLRCDCGSVLFRTCSAMRRGNTKSCGCLASEHGHRIGLIYARKKREED